MSLITIASVTVSGWQGNTSGVSLRIYTNADFTAATGTFYPRTVPDNLKSAGLGTFYQSYPCTVANGALTIPAVSVDSTTDSTDNPASTYSAVLWDGTSGKPIQTFGTSSSFALPPTPAATTWAAIFTGEEIE